MTSGSELASDVSYAFPRRSGSRQAASGSPLLGMKEGCSGEKVLGRER